MKTSNLQYNNWFSWASWDGQSTRTCMLHRLTVYHIR